MKTIEQTEKEQLKKPSIKKRTLSEKERDEMIFYWAKQLENKKLSLHELFENGKWLLDNVK